MLITPAIASEPYCAAAPSRSTSMWSMAEIGIALMSVPAEPRRDGLLHVDQRLLVAALAVDQHQHLVGTERAQRGRAQDVGAVADGGAREVEARFEHLQDLADFLRAGAFELFAVDHVDRRRRLGGGAAARARAEDLDRIEGRRLVLGRLGRLGRRLLRLRGKRQDTGRKPEVRRKAYDGELPLRAVRIVAHGGSLPNEKTAKSTARRSGGTVPPARLLTLV